MEQTILNYLNEQKELIKQSIELEEQLLFSWRENKYQRFTNHAKVCGFNYNEKVEEIMSRIANLEQRRDWIKQQINSLA